MKQTRVQRITTGKRLFNILRARPEVCDRLEFGHVGLDPEECAKNLKSALKKGREKGCTVKKIIFSHENNSLVGCLAIQFAQNPLSTKVVSGISKSTW